MLHFSTVKTENHRNGIPPMVPPVGPLGWLRSLKFFLLAAARFGALRWPVPELAYPSFRLIGPAAQPPVRFGSATSVWYTSATPASLWEFASRSSVYAPSGEPLYGRCFELSIG